jgi:hypothetical protein
VQAILAVPVGVPAPEDHRNYTADERNGIDEAHLQIGQTQALNDLRLP